QPVAIPEDDLHELRDLRRVGLVAEDVDLRRGIVEVAPRVEMDDVFLGLIGRRIVAHGWLLVGIEWLGGHAARLQHRSAWAQNRHSKKSRLVAMRGSSSPASVA